MPFALREATGLICRDESNALFRSGREDAVAAASKARYSEVSARRLAFAVLVEHDMKFIGELVNGGQREKKKIVTVLHEGSVLAEGALADVQANERVVEVYLGR